MNYLVIHTGGTIACKSASGVLSPDSCSHLFERFRKLNGNSYVFDETVFSNLLSENADDVFYSELINYINSCDLTAYDGVIITHGTDTLSYTSSLVAMCLRHITVPVAFVSANYVVDDERSNAMSNLDIAVRYFLSGGKGFIVPYENSDSRRLVHLATRLCEADSVTDSFNSIGFAPLAEIIKNYTVSFEQNSLPDIEALTKPKTSLIKDKTQLSNKILLIKGYPSIDFSCYSLNNTKVSAVLYSAYHSGTATTNGLPDFIKECLSNGVDFYLAPCKKSDDVYETTKQLFECGAKPVYNTTTESALAKLKIKYNISDIDVNDNLYFEMI